MEQKKMRKVLGCSQVHGCGIGRGRRTSQMHKLWPERFKDNHKSSVSQKQGKYSSNEEVTSRTKEGIISNVKCKEDIQ